MKNSEFGNQGNRVVKNNPFWTGSCLTKKQTTKNTISVRGSVACMKSFLRNKIG